MAEIAVFLYCMVKFIAIWRSIFCASLYLLCALDLNFGKICQLPNFRIIRYTRHNTSHFLHHTGSSRGIMSQSNNNNMAINCRYNIIIGHLITSAVLAPLIRLNNHSVTEHIEPTQQQCFPSRTLIRLRTLTVNAWGLLLQ